VASERIGGMLVIGCSPFPLRKTLVAVENRSACPDGWELLARSTVNQMSVGL
jgi:hypothetical protein